MKDYYKILELPFASSSVEIKRAYYKLAFKYHPDRNFGKQLFEEVFKEITEAYAVLSDENKRIRYHAAYNDHLHGITTRQPDTPFTRDPYYRHKPSGPASPVTVEFKGLKMVIGILLITLVLLMLFNAIKYDKINTSKREEVKSLSPVKVLTREEYYDMLHSSRGDSAFLKMDFDSMWNVIDSLNVLKK